MKNEGIYMREGSCYVQILHLVNKRIFANESENQHHLIRKKY